MAPRHQLRGRGPQGPEQRNTKTTTPTIDHFCGYKPLLDKLNNSYPPVLSDLDLLKIYVSVKQQIPLTVAGLSFGDLEKECLLFSQAISDRKLVLIRRNPSTSSFRQRSFDPPSFSRPPLLPPPDVSMGPTPTLDQFLSEISRFIHSRNGAQLQDYLVIEPPFRPLYDRMIAEIAQSYPKGEEEALEEKCDIALGASSWTPFTKFIVSYFSFIRDVNRENPEENLLETYNLLSELLQKCNSALRDDTMGIVMLPTVTVYSRVLARLAIGLDKRPELIVHLAKQTDDGERETLPERAANILRQAFVTCLYDKTQPTNGPRVSKPEGRKVGIYKIANLCLKILFQCDKHLSSEHIFDPIQKHAPPLSIYPSSERVTYLYYLGRLFFMTGHFFRAQLGLQEAYDQCSSYPNPAQALRQRRLILVYLVTSSVTLGRFPSQELYSLPEAAGFRERFQPICRAIAKGDLARFRLLTDHKSEHAAWFLHHRVLMQLRSRCEVLVWRSLARRAFLLVGDKGNSAEKKAPTLELNHLVVLAQYLTRRARNPISQFDGGPGRRHTNWVFMGEPPSQIKAHPEYDGMDTDYEGSSDEGGEENPEWDLPDMTEIESIVSSLISQGLLGGFISHRLQRFAIQGVKRKGIMDAGFPNVWEVLTSKHYENDKGIPGWTAKGADLGAGSGFQAGPGMQIHLSGVRGIGS